MQDFSLIEADVNFLNGVYAHISDGKNDYYALEFYEKFGEDWVIVWSSQKWYPYHWFRHNKKFRNFWRVKIWGWEDDSPKQLLSKTYSDKGENVCLEFVHDSYKTHKKWTELAIKFSSDNECKIIIVSKFYSRLEEEFFGEKIFFSSPINDWDSFFESEQIYSKFTISKFDIQSRTEDWWESRMIFENHANPVKTWHHRKDWVGLSDEQIFNDIMGL